MQEMQEMWVWPLGWEDILEEGMATHSRILAWRIPCKEEPGGHSPWGHKELDTTGVTEHMHTSWVWEDAELWMSSYLTEKVMAPHSSTLAWKFPWTEEPGRLQSMGSRRVRHDWATSLSLFPFMHWRRKCQPTPVFLAGEFQRQGSLVCCHLWGHTESDTTEAT